MMLDGIRVIDLGSFITAPLAAMMLGDMGADVIKVERPEGDPFRGNGGYAATFLAFNRNKRGITLDSTTSEGRKTLLELVDTADILIDNYRAPVLRKLGLDSEVLRARNPRLIHCSITGFGATGPYRDRPAFDSVGQALSGLMSLLIDPEAPRAFGPTISDNVTGMYAAYAVLGALVERGRTARGKRIEVNMLECSMAFIQDIFVNYTRTGIVNNPFTRVARSQCFAFRCSDGKGLAVHFSTTEKFWCAFAAAIDAESLVTDERFVTHQRRVEHYSELSALLSERISTEPRNVWMERLAAADIPFSPIHSVAEALDDPQVQALGALTATLHSTEGAVTGIACPVLADGSRPREKMRPPPKRGEHTDEILAEIEAWKRSRR